MVPRVGGTIIGAAAGRDGPLLAIPVLPGLLGILALPALLDPLVLRVALVLPAVLVLIVGVVSTPQQATAVGLTSIPVTVPLDGIPVESARIIRVPLLSYLPASLVHMVRLLTEIRPNVPKPFERATDVTPGATMILPSIVLFIDERSRTGRPEHI